MMPGGELFDRGADSGGVDGVEFVGQPGFEAGEMFIALWEQSVVLQQAAQVIDMAAGSRSGEAVVSQWYCAGSDPAEHLQYLNVPLPGQDAFGSVDAAEDFDERVHSGWVGGVMQQDCAQVPAQGATRAFAPAVKFAFLSAALAGVVVGNAGASQADRP